MAGSRITIDVNGESVPAYLAGNGKRGVLVLHSWWGLNSFFEGLCERLAQWGYTVMAPDLNRGLVAKTPDEAQALMDARDSELVGDTVMAAVKALSARTGGQPVGVIGFSMGAAWTLIAAAHVPDKVGAAVVFYGAEMPDFSKFTAPVLAHHSDADEWESAEFVGAMRDAMHKAGVTATFHNYTGMPHWFVETDRPEYREDEANLAWERTKAFLAANL